jgi:hypothetical protein
MLLARHARPCAGHPRLAVPAKSEDVDGRVKPGHDDLKKYAEHKREAAYAASAALAFSAIAWNAAGSWIARSDSTLRSTVMPDLARPLINTL